MLPKLEKRGRGTGNDHEERELGKMGKNLTISHFSFFLLPLLIPLSPPAVRSAVSGNILSPSLARKLCTVAWGNSRYCWFARDVTAAMLVVKNKSISLLWELNSIFMEILWEKLYCIDPQHGRLVTWLQTKNFATPRLNFPRNDVWGTGREIPYLWRVTIQVRVVLRIGHHCQQET